MVMFMMMIAFMMDDDCDLLGDELSWIVSVNRARQK